MACHVVSKTGIFGTLYDYKAKNTGLEWKLKLQVKKACTPVKFHRQAYIFIIHSLATCETKAVLGDTATRRQLVIQTLTFVIFCNNVSDFFQKIIQWFGVGVCEKTKRSRLFGLFSSSWMKFFICWKNQFKGPRMADETDVIMLRIMIAPKESVIWNSTFVQLWLFRNFFPFVPTLQCWRGKQ